ncbi:hypothetical protein WQ54_29225 [Bacillus sp. SA1-12]|nr:hypothetical protein WQ54_29225 [Bacillus sp. SA1-12]
MYEINFEFSDPAFFFNVLIITLAIVQIGNERSNGSLEYTLSLPFSRQSIFLFKWLVGFGVIFISCLISFGLSALIITNTDIYSDNFISYFTYLIEALLLFYTLTLSAGAITGSAFAQGLVALTVAILPFLLFGLYTVQLEAITGPSVLYSNEKFYEVISKMTPLTYVFFKNNFLISKDYITPIIEILLFFAFGLYIFVKQPFERNGSFFIWKPFERPVQMIVILLGILGFSSFGYLSSEDNSMIGYFIGAAIGAFIGFIVSYFVIYKKKK